MQFFKDTFNLYLWSTNLAKLIYNVGTPRILYRTIFNFMIFSIQYRVYYKYWTQPTFWFIWFMDLCWLPIGHWKRFETILEGMPLSWVYSNHILWSCALIWNVVSTQCFELFVSSEPVMKVCIMHYFPWRFPLHPLINSMAFLVCYFFFCDVIAVSWEFIFMEVNPSGTAP